MLDPSEGTRSLVTTRPSKVTATKVVAATHVLHNLLRKLDLPHRRACSGTICHTGTALSAKHACMQSHNPPHRLARGCMPSHMLLHMMCLPHKHACRCKTRHTGMHAHSAHRLYMPHRHEYICIICHGGMHTVAYFATQVVSATQACMQAHNLPHRHARTALSAKCSGIICHTCGCTICHILLY